MSKIFSTSVVSISVTKPFVSGGIVSDRYLHLLFDVTVVSTMGADGNGIWTRCSLKINDETYYLWRAVDHEGEVLEAYVTQSRNRQAALIFLRKAMKHFGEPEVIITDGLSSYRAALRTLGMEDRHHTGRWQINRVENSHQPLRQRE